MTTSHHDQGVRKKATVQLGTHLRPYGNPLEMSGQSRRAARYSSCGFVLVSWINKGGENPFLSCGNGA